MPEFQARLFDELTPLYPDSNIAEGMDSYTVSGCNGTYAGVHIGISGLTPGIPLTIDIEGPHTAFKTFRMIPVPVEVNTGAKQRSEYLKNDHNDNVIRRAPFMVYEVLDPIYNIAMPELTTMGLAFKTIIEYCREQCTEEWIIHLGHGGKYIVLTLKVEKFPAVVPKANKDTHKFVNWFSFDAIAQCHGLVKWSKPYEEMLYSYLRAAVFSRQNMLAIPLNEVFDGLQLNHERFRTIVNIAKKAGIAWFQGGAPTNRAFGLADNDEFYNSLDHDAITNPDEVAKQFSRKAFDLFDYGDKARVGLTGELLPGAKGEQQLTDILCQLDGAVKANGLSDCWIQCALDEPNDALCEVYRLITDIMRRAMPGVVIMEPVLPTESIIGALDIWCPTVETYELNRAFFDERVAKGDHLYVYTCLTPGGNYLNRMLDLERLRVVYIAWAAAVYPNVEGFLHWGGNHQPNGGNTLVRQAAMFEEQVLEFHPKRAMFLPAGDAGIFFPGYNQPLISVRSEAHRIGFEDLCLIEQLKVKDSACVDGIVAKLVRGYCDFEKSVERYREVKRELLTLISD